jgi:hypothetical protein
MVLKPFMTIYLNHTIFYFIVSISLIDANTNPNKSPTSIEDNNIIMQCLKIKK